jgi:hypothetical protein
LLTSAISEYKTEKVFNDNIEEGRIAMNIKSNVKAGAGIGGLIISS